MNLKQQNSSQTKKKKHSNWFKYFVLFHCKDRHRDMCHCLYLSCHIDFIFFVLVLNIISTNSGKINAVLNDDKIRYCIVPNYVGCYCNFSTLNAILFINFISQNVTVLIICSYNPIKMC